MDPFASGFPGTSVAETEGIQIEVRCAYVPEQSAPQAGRYLFAYLVKIRNVGSAPAQLISRHWIITDSTGEVSEVKGLGVVGEQPVLKPGADYEYMSGSHLKSPLGTMQGTYQMATTDGEKFDAQIPVFTLSVPRILN